MRIPIDLNNTLTLTTSGISGPDIQQVGSDPVWEDDSDATYVDVVGKYFGPGNPQYFSQARAALPAQTFAPAGLATSSHLRLRMDIRLMGLQSGLPLPRIQWVDASNVAYSPDGTPALAPTSPTTVTLEWSSYGGGSAWSNPELYHIEVAAAGLSPAPGDGGAFVTRNWYVYEVHPYWYIPVNVAPPCRIFPNPNYGVGAGRNHPPTKAQQGGVRGVGYY